MCGVGEAAIPRTALSVPLPTDQWTGTVTVRVGTHTHNICSVCGLHVVYKMLKSAKRTMCGSLKTTNQGSQG